MGLTTVKNRMIDGAVGSLYTIKNASGGTDIYVAGITTRSSTGATSGTTTTDNISL
jgi:hypothetical protein